VRYRRGASSVPSLARDGGTVIITLTICVSIAGVKFALATTLTLVGLVFFSLPLFFPYILFFSSFPVKLNTFVSKYGGVECFRDGNKENEFPTF